MPFAALRQFRVMAIAPRAVPPASAVEVCPVRRRKPSMFFLSIFFCFSFPPEPLGFFPVFRDGFLLGDQQAGGVRDVHVLICTRVVQIGVATNVHILRPVDSILTIFLSSFRGVFV